MSISSLRKIDNELIRTGYVSIICNADGYKFRYWKQDGKIIFPYTFGNMMVSAGENFISPDMVACNDFTKSTGMIFDMPVYTKSQSCIINAYNNVITSTDVNVYYAGKNQNIKKYILNPFVTRNMSKYVDPAISGIIDMSNVLGIISKTMSTEVERDYISLNISLNDVKNINISQNFIVSYEKPTVISNDVYTAYGNFMKTATNAMSKEHSNFREVILKETNTEVLSLVSMSYIYENVDLSNPMNIFIPSPVFDIDCSSDTDICISFHDSNTCVRIF